MEVEVPTNIATGVPTNNTYQHLRSEGRLDCRNIVEACRDCILYYENYNVAVVIERSALARSEAVVVIIFVNYHNIVERSEAVVVKFVDCHVCNSTH